MGRTALIIACLLAAGCTPVPAPEPETAPEVDCPEDTWIPPALLQCDEAIALALELLTDDHPPLEVVRFEWGYYCSPPWPRCGPPTDEVGHVVYTFSDGTEEWFVDVEKSDLDGSVHPIGPPEPLWPDDSATNEVPARLMASVLWTTQVRTGALAEEIQVIHAEALVWEDGSLGCPEPGTVHPVAPVEGYHVVLQVGEQQLDWRIPADGTMKLCR
jgi:hypothetical protein